MSSTEKQLENGFDHALSTIIVQNLSSSSILGIIHLRHSVVISTSFKDVRGVTALSRAFESRSSLIISPALRLLDYLRQDLLDALRNLARAAREELR